MQSRVQNDVNAEKRSIEYLNNPVLWIAAHLTQLMLYRSEPMLSY